jgi:2-polyprenyl-3-methyl-5-hydroxy-6-metoxy-1,4-benzoquinol methylase
MHDDYLDKNFRDYLAVCCKRCKNSNLTIYDIFHDMPDDNLWHVLISREYDNYQLIKQKLPGFPPPELQAAWCGKSGRNLCQQSFAFYKRAKDIFSTLGKVKLPSAVLLDFGCGWGRLLRYFAKDMPDKALFGCDPDENMINLCAELKVPGTIRLSDYRPKSLPFTEKFNFVYAYSVFTHLSEKSHFECLQCIHDGVVDNGILIVTVRPPKFIKARGGELSKLSDGSINDMITKYNDGKFIFHPHNRAPVDGDITFGEAIIPTSYIEKNWSKMFTLVKTLVFIADPNQVLVILRKRG